MRLSRVDEMCRCESMRNVATECVVPCFSLQGPPGPSAIRQDVRFLLQEERAVVPTGRRKHSLAQRVVR